MIILGIESSCDETAAAVMEISASGKSSADKGVTILSNVVASSAKLQEIYGGVIPEQAAREQIKSIIPVIETAISHSQLAISQIDAIAVTFGPGLIGSLLVGVETAKTLALVWKKPLIPINHLIGHFYANWISSTPTFPAIGLLVSGGHTDLLLFKDHDKYEILGGTRDDAAGECFDKCARLLGLSYPGGPAIARLAESASLDARRAKRAKLALQVKDPEHSRRRDALQLKLPRPMINSKDFDFSFSGLKTAVANLPDKNNAADLAAAIQQAIIDVLVRKTIRAVEKYGVKSLIVAGGVAANQKLVSELAISCQPSARLPDGQAIRLFVPPPELCTDNAAMIAAAAFFNYHPINPLNLQADPNLNLS